MSTVHSFPVWKLKTYCQLPSIKLQTSNFKPCLKPDRLHWQSATWRLKEWKTSLELESWVIGHNKVSNTTKSKQQSWIRGDIWHHWSLSMTRWLDCLHWFCLDITISNAQISSLKIQDESMLSFEHKRLEVAASANWLCWLAVRRLLSSIGPPPQTMSIDCIAKNFWPAQHAHVHAQIQSLQAIGWPYQSTCWSITEIPSMVCIGWGHCKELDRHTHTHKQNRRVDGYRMKTLLCPSQPTTANLDSFASPNPARFALKANWANIGWTVTLTALNCYVTESSPRWPKAAWSRGPGQAIASRFVESAGCCINPKITN